MYKIVNSEGQELGRTEAPYYIKVAANGSYAPCTVREAQGLSYRGRVYRLFGRNGLTGEHETVLVVQTDSGEELDGAAETAAIAFVLLAEAGQIDDVTAGERYTLFSQWHPGVAYAVNQLRQHKEKLYRCIQAHTSQEGWEPDKAASLWRPVADPAEEWPAWSQPICAADAYGSGDRVSYGGKHWVSTCDANVWEPGVYGWAPAENE